VYIDFESALIHNNQGRNNTEWMKEREEKGMKERKKGKK